MKNNIIYLIFCFIFPLSAVVSPTEACLLSACCGCSLFAYKKLSNRQPHSPTQPTLALTQPSSTISDGDGYDTIKYCSSAESDEFTKNLKELERTKNYRKNKSKSP